MNLCSVHFNRKKQTNRTKQVQTELEKFSFSLSYEIKAALSSPADHFLVTCLVVATGTPYAPLFVDGKLNPFCNVIAISTRKHKVLHFLSKTEHSVI